MSDSRCPKDIKTMISGSKSLQQPKTADGEQVIEELAKLRGLSQDDKTENALLRSRIDEQSELIMILKKRADEVTTQLQTSERIRQSLDDFKQQAQGSLDMEIKKSEMLDQRFNELAENHQELIKFKDQYKIENERLRKENEKLKQDNERLFSGALQEKQLMIDDLEVQLKDVKEKCQHLDEKYLDAHKSMIENRRVLLERLEKTEDSLNSQITTLKNQLSETERKLQETARKYNGVMDKNDEMEAENKHQILRLTKEKNELLDLVMQRGKTIEEKTAEIKKMEEQVEKAVKRQKEAEERFEREAAAVDSNLQVIKLRKELNFSQTHMAEVDKKFEAYKAHTNKLLQQERDLNAKLRHLVS